MTRPVAIAFVEPPALSSLRGFPLGIASLAACISRHLQLNAHILDFQSVQDWTSIEASIRDLCRSSGTRFFGIRTITPLLREAVRLSALIRQAAPDAVLIAGGPHASASPEAFLRRYPAFDIVVIGEGEHTVLDLLAVLRAGGDPGTVAGIAYRDPQGTVRLTAPRAPLSEQDLGALPWDYAPFLAYDAYARDDRSAMVVTSRGCAFSCAFCAASQFWGPGGYRARPVENVLDELESLVLEQGIRRIYFEDALFNPDKGRVMALCDGIRARRRRNPAFDFTWRPPCRVDLLDREMLSAMKEAGCTDIFFGLESFDERQLRAIKGGAVAHTHDAYAAYLSTVDTVFAACRSVGIETIASMIMGLPYETDATFRTNIAFLRRLQPSKISFSVLSLYAGTPLVRAYAREPGFSWLSTVLERDDLFDLPLDDGPGSAAIAGFAVHGPRSIKPRYLMRRAWEEEGIIRHDVPRIIADYQRYRDGLGADTIQCISIESIQGTPCGGQPCPRKGSAS